MSTKKTKPRGTGATKEQAAAMRATANIQPGAMHRPVRDRPVVQKRGR
jgi:hypothetical protein